VVLVVAMTGQGRAGIITADVAVLSPGGHYAPLEAGELVFKDYSRYSWHEMPTFAEEDSFLFWQIEKTGFPSVADGITTFEVLNNGPVLLACTTRWGGGGNDSGGWIPELTTREQLEDQGWVEFATGLADIKNGTTVNRQYIVFRRDSVAGEVFTYRTEKYRAPLIIRSEAVIPEPSTLAIWSLLGLTGAGVAGWRRRRVCRYRS
jgi:hypothetical protein